MRKSWRWLAIAILAGGACGGSGSWTPHPSGQGGDFPGGSGGSGAGGGSGNRWTGMISGSVNRNVDILFLIDDSSSMRLEQANLINNFPSFLTTLQNDPHGMPNLHLAVVSQDMGAGDGSIAGCDSTGGKQGIFQYTARGSCTATGLQTGATYISDGFGVKNYSGDLATVFGCIAALGETGCGFEHQFAAILRALGADGNAAPQENQGFLRPEASLVVVMLTNEDDCSASPGVPLYDTSQNQNIESQLGPPSNFRCNEFGHMCGSGSGSLARPGRFAPNNDVTSTVTYDVCTSNETDEYLLRVRDTAESLKVLKNDPSQVAVIAITGQAMPYVVHWKNPSTSDTSCNATGQSCPWPEITHSCTAPDGSFADPGVRTAQLVNQFGVRGLVLPACDSSYAPSLMRAGQLINGLLGPPCLPGPIGLNAATGQPDCKVTERYGTTSKAVPSCDGSPGAAPCWQLDRVATCGSNATLTVMPDPNVPVGTPVTIGFDCAKCTSADPLLDCY